MAGCVASASCLASPAARTAASSPALGGVRSPDTSSPWRHVDLQEDHDLAAEHAPKRASDHRNVGERIRTVDLDETEALGPPTDDGLTNSLLEAGLLQRCAVPRALDQVGCPSNASSNSPVFSTFSSAPLALVHLVGRHDPVLALGVLDLLRPRVVHRQHVNASASGKAKLPATSRPWTLAMLHYHVSENSRSGCLSACVDACSLFRVCSP